MDYWSSLKEQTKKAYAHGVMLWSLNRLKGFDEFINNPNIEFWAAWMVARIKNPRIPKKYMKRFHMAALRYNGLLIEYIDFPDEELQLTAVKEDGNALKLLDNPSDKVIAAAEAQFRQRAITIYGTKVIIEKLKDAYKIINIGNKDFAEWLNLDEEDRFRTVKSIREYVAYKLGWYTGQQEPDKLPGNRTTTIFCK